MSRRLRPLMIMTLAMTLLASAAAEGDATDSVAPFSVLTNATISCSVAAPSWTTGCFVERPAFVLGPLEVAFGVDAQAVLSTGEYHLAPYVIAAIYMESWSAWGEFALPGDSIPIIGRPDYLRVGFSYRFGGNQ